MKQDSISYIDNVSAAVGDSTALLRARDFDMSMVQGSIDSLSYSQALYKSVSEVDTGRYNGVKLPFSLEQADAVFGLLLLCLLFFSHIYNGGLTFFKENIALLFLPSRNERLPSETTGRETLFTSFLVFQSLILAAICLYSYFIGKELPETNSLSPFVNIVSIAGLLGAFLLLKILGYKVLGYILDISFETKIWIRLNVLILQILGILYFIPTLLLVYSKVLHSQIIILILILFVLTQLTLFYRITAFFIREKFNYLFLIAYLCSSEIIPYIFLAVGLFLFYQNDVFNMLL